MVGLGLVEALSLEVDESEGVDKTVTEILPVYIAEEDVVARMVGSSGRTMSGVFSRVVSGIKSGDTKPIWAFSGFDGKGLSVDVIFEDPLGIGWAVGVLVITSVVSTGVSSAVLTSGDLKTT